MNMPQRWLVKLVKAVFVLSFACFLLIQIHSRRPHLYPAPLLQASNDWPKNLVDFSANQPESEVVRSNEVHRSVDEQQSLLAAEANLSPNRSILWTLERLGSPSAGIDDREGIRSSTLPLADEIRRSVEDNNANAPIWNDAKFASKTDIDFVVVVQVHNRPKYLEKLIFSLGNSTHINRTLLIFSHDYISHEINKLIQSIDFCRVMQIVYPYNLQIFTKSFPAQEPDDCGPEMKREEAEKIKCNHWQSPDKYGHYRTAKNSQVKHHWWWKINYVFDGIPRLRNYTGWVLLLEEDHYVSPDFLHVFGQIIRRKTELCEECSIITLGFYLKKYDEYTSTMDQLSTFPWFSSHHNMGMAFNRVTWNKIKQCKEAFCTYDDYNWDWSLMHVNLKCMPQPRMRVIFAKAPRVFHIGDCGIHHKGQECTADFSATKVTAILDAARPKMFPLEMRIVERSGKTLKAPKENGGWADKRDHQLCLNVTFAISETKLL